MIWHVCYYSRHKHKLLILSRLSDFVVCNTSLYICSSGVYLRFRTLREVEIQLI